MINQSQKIKIIDAIPQILSMTLPNTIIELTQCRKPWVLFYGHTCYGFSIMLGFFVHLLSADDCDLEMEDCMPFLSFTFIVTRAACTFL